MKRTNLLWLALIPLVTTAPSGLAQVGQIKQQEPNDATTYYYMGVGVPIGASGCLLLAIYCSGFGLIDHSRLTGPRVSSSQPFIVVTRNSNGGTCPPSYSTNRFGSGSSL
jgi:hypothetical protein